MTPIRKDVTKPSLQALVKAALKRSPYFWVQSVRCRCDGKEIVLEGGVNSYYEKQLAQEIVAHLPGATRIVNHIEVRSY